MAMPPPELSICGPVHLIGNASANVHVRSASAVCSVSVISLRCGLRLRGREPLEQHVLLGEAAREHEVGIVEAAGQAVDEVVVAALAVLEHVEAQLEPRAAHEEADRVDVGDPEDERVDSEGLDAGGHAVAQKGCWMSWPSCSCSSRRRRRSSSWAASPLAPPPPPPPPRAARPDAAALCAAAPSAPGMAAPACAAAAPASATAAWAAAPAPEAAVPAADARSPRDIRASWRGAGLGAGGAGAPAVHRESVRVAAGGAAGAGGGDGGGATVRDAVARGGVTSRMLGRGRAGAAGTAVGTAGVAERLPRPPSALRSGPAAGAAAAAGGGPAGRWRRGLNGAGWASERCGPRIATGVAVRPVASAPRRGASVGDGSGGGATREVRVMRGKAAAVASTDGSCPAAPGVLGASWGARRGALDVTGVSWGAWRGALDVTGVSWGAWRGALDVTGVSWGAWRGAPGLTGIVGAADLAPVRRGAAGSADGCGGAGATAAFATGAAPLEVASRGDRSRSARGAGRDGPGSCFGPAADDGRPLSASSARRTGPGRGAGGGGVVCRGARRSAGRVGCADVGGATRCTATRGGLDGVWRASVSCACGGGGAAGSAAAGAATGSSAGSTAAGAATGSSAAPGGTAGVRLEIRSFPAVRFADESRAGGAGSVAA